MPLYTYYCDSCERFVKTISNRVPGQTPKCKFCGEKTVRAYQAPTSNITETLDNGFMSRKIERPADAERLFKERAASDQDRIKNPKL